MTTTSGLAMQIVEVTPEMAKRALEDANRPRNRPIRTREVKKIAAAMESGNFYGLTGEAVVFTAPLDEGGKLVEGQHRLKAIEITGMPQQMMVIYGVDAEKALTYRAGGAKPEKMPEIA